MEPRQYVDSHLRPLARRLPLSPDMITLLAVLAMTGAAGCAIADHLGWAGALILVSGLLDLLDGAVARANARASAFGALLDRSADRAADFIIIAGLLLGGHVEAWLALYVLLTVPLASYISACMEAATSSNIGSRISLRAVRILILALACISGLVVEGTILLAVIGTWAVVSRLRLARRILD